MAPLTLPILDRHRAIVITLLAALVAASALIAPGRAPAAGREVSFWLAVESSAVDGDLELEAVDRARFRQRFGIEAEGVLVDSREGRKYLEAPPVWLALAATARRLAGWTGVYLVQGLLVAIAALLGLTTIRARLGAGPAALLTAVTFLATATMSAALRLEPRAVELAAMALAAAAIWKRAAGPAVAPEQIYRGESGTGPGALRWLLAGSAFGVVLLGSASYLVLAVPLLAAAPEFRTWRLRAAFLLAAAVVVLAALGLGGPPWKPAQPILSPALFAWGAIGMLVGRGVGLLPYFLPAAMLVTAVGRDDGRRWVVPSVFLCLLLQLALAPFDYAEGAGGVGNAWFLPVLALLLAAASHEEGRAWTLAIALAGAPFLAGPVWLDALRLSGPSAAISRLMAPLVELLPEATSLRTVPGVVELERAGLVVRGLEPAVFGAADGRLRLLAREATLVVIADRALSSLRVDLGSTAPVAITAKGARLGNTTIRPNGDLAVDLVLDAGKARRHPVWWSPSGAWIHIVTLQLPSAPSAPIAFDVAWARSLVPRAGEGR